MLSSRKQLIITIFQNLYVSYAIVVYILWKVSFATAEIFYQKFTHLFTDNIICNFDHVSILIPF